MGREREREYLMGWDVFKGKRERVFNGIREREREYLMG